MKGMFVKYPSIENSYREKEINTWLGYHPELMNEAYILNEKIHGSNLQLIFKPGLPVYFASRNRLLHDENFHGLHEVIVKDTIKSFIAEMEKHSTDTRNTLRFYGELFGANLQKGVDYGKERQIRFFDMSVSGMWQTQTRFLDFMENDGFLSLAVPSFAVVTSLREALEFDIKKDSLILNKENNIIEGVVIKPYNKVYESPEGSLFYLKKKNEEFKENSRKPKDFTDINPDVVQYGVIFREYITENRLQNVFSKYGEIERPNQIGDYIRYMLEDAKEDFLKDYDLSEFADKDKKAIFNVGSLIVTMLKKNL